MHSKQRVLKTVNHEPADRVPVNLSTNRFVREFLMNRLKLKSHIDLLNHFNSGIVDLQD
jgi:hypothetical protein